MSDFEFLSVSFEFEGCNYYSLIRRKRKQGDNEYVITIMNGKLEKLLYGNHIIKEVNGQLVSEQEPPNPKQAQLKKAILDALRNFLIASRQKTTAESLTVRVNH